MEKKASFVEVFFQKSGSATILSKEMMWETLTSEPPLPANLSQALAVYEQMHNVTVVKAHFYEMGDKEEDLFRMIAIPKGDYSYKTAVWVVRSGMKHEEVIAALLNALYPNWTVDEVEHYVDFQREPSSELAKQYCQLVGRRMLR